MFVDIGLKFYAVPTLCDLEVKVTDFEILVKVFISLYLLNIVMDQVDTLHVCR